jgi:hypothetical protein
VTAGRTLFVLAIWFWLVKPVLEPYLGSLPYANLTLATASGLVLLVGPWCGGAEGCGRVSNGSRASRTAFDNDLGGPESVAVTG